MSFENDVIHGYFLDGTYYEFPGYAKQAKEKIARQFTEYVLDLLEVERDVHLWIASWAPFLLYLVWEGSELSEGLTRELEIRRKFREIVELVYPEDPDLGELRFTAKPDPE